MQPLVTPTICRNEAPLAARTYSTDEAARILHIRPQTLRAAYCRNGHYFNVIPRKCKNRFLSWPAKAIDALIDGGAQ